MEHRKKVEIITDILQANEEVLSDGYHFYCKNADLTLVDIAEAILTGIEGGQAADAELLAACEQALLVLENTDDFGPCPETCADLRAAIEKAKGAA